MKVKEAPDLITFLKLSRGCHPFLFRGQPKHNKPLLPCIAREWTKTLRPLISVERTMMREWKNRALPFLQIAPNNPWEWLVLAQHYGMPTRLLDWTGNPLVALYFACVSDMDSDGAVFIISLNSNLHELNFRRQPDPFKITKPVYFTPPHITPRLAAQSSYFTAVPNPLETLKCSLNIVIRGSRKKNVLDELDHLGINSSMLFPDLTGIAQHIAYQTLQLKGWYLQDSGIA